MPDGGFDLEGVLAQAAQGKLTPDAVSQPQSAPTTIPTMTIQAGGNTAPSGGFDLEGLLKQASRGSLAAPPTVSQTSKAASPDDGAVQGVTEFGAPIYSDAAKNAQVTEGEGRVLEKAGEGATFGLLPYGIAAAKTLGGTPFNQGLQQARDYTAQTSEQYPAASLIAEGAGSILPTVATFGAINPLEQAAARVLPKAGAALVRTVAGAGLGGAQAAGTDIGSGNTPNIAGDAAKGAALGGALQGGAELAGAGLNAVANKAGQYGIGSKADFGGIKATPAQAAAAGQKVADAVGPEGQQNIDKAFAAEAQAKGIETNPDAAFHAAEAERLAAKADTVRKLGLPFFSNAPTEVIAADAAWQARNRALLPDPSVGPGVAGPGNVPPEIQSQRVNIVPGSQPTTAQLAQTPGATDLENALRVQNGPAFVDRAQQQNNARIASTQALEPNGGQTASVGQFFADHLKQIDADAQQEKGALASSIQGKTTAVGGDQHIAQYGAQTRDLLTSKEAPERAAASAAFKAIDPDGKWAIQSSPLKDTAKQIASEVSPTANTDSQVNALLKRAQSLPDVIPFRTLSQLRADANDGLRRLARTGSAPAEVRRLTIFKDGIDQTIAQSVSERAAADPAFGERVNATTGRAVSEAGGVETAPGGSVGNQRNDGTGGGQGGSGNLPGDIAGTRPPADATQPPAAGTGSLTPNVGADEAAKYYDAVQGYKDLKTKFGQGGVGAVLAKNDQGFRVPEGNVTSKIFTGGKTEPAEVERFITAAGGPDQAADIGRNVLANDLRTKGIITPEGLVKADKLKDWIGGRGETLDQFPGLRDQFKDLETTQRTLDDVTAAHKAAVDEFNHSAAANFIKLDPAVAVARAFASGNATQTFTQLAQAVRGNQAATDGLKRAVVDYIVQRHSSATPSAGEDNMLKSGVFQKWIAANKGPLRALFGGQGSNNLEMVAADLRRQASGPTAVAGSQTASHQARAARLGTAVSHNAPTLLALLGEHVGEIASHAVGGLPIVGSAIGIAAGLAGPALRQAGIKTINDLTREAMLHPELARVLMERAGSASKTVPPVAQRRIAAALQAAIAADFGNQGEKKVKLAAAMLFFLLPFTLIAQTPPPPHEQVLRDKIAEEVDAELVSRTKVKQLEAINAQLIQQLADMKAKADQKAVAPSAKAP